MKGRARREKLEVGEVPIARTDALAFQKDSGVPYFVFAVNGKTGHCKPYCALLSPFAIEHLINQGPRGQGQISVPLKELPADSRLLGGIVGLALKTHEQNIPLDSILGTSERFPPRLIAERRIRFVRVGRHVRIPEDALSEFVRDGEVALIDLSHLTGA